ncbi:hypothetical protein S40288_06795 [Stachybotrys chartarum IBT 40288]|nr:hypothetical protein S40288_06795 [Stachybotrys chartarum IBT 40288]
MASAAAPSSVAAVLPNGPTTAIAADAALPDNTPTSASAPTESSTTPAAVSLAEPSRSQSRDATEHYASIPSAFQYAPDGRIRNPVPSKLIGKTDSKSGNFGVMHVDLARARISERDAAAKRTSEETAAAAQLARKNGYQSVKPTKLQWHPTPAEQQSPAPAQAASQARSLPPQAQAPTQFPPELTPHEIKAQQARLLTLMRSINPVLIVDQLCKALAYFGGIPGAPPTPHGNHFPISNGGNGPGSQFVSWVAEIFPHVDGAPGAEHLLPSSQSATWSATAPAAQVDTPTIDNPRPAKKRGRPKGSKSTKVRRDKGVKKSAQGAAASAGDTPQSAPNQPAQTSTQPVTNNSEPALDNIQPTASTDNNPSSHFASTVANTADAFLTPQANRTSAASATATRQMDPEVSVLSTPGSKKRGRPKGSKNRPKPPIEAVTNTPVASGQGPTPETALPAPSAQDNNTSQSNTAEHQGRQASSMLQQYASESVGLTANGMPNMSTAPPSSAPVSTDAEQTSSWVGAGAPASQPSKPVEKPAGQTSRKRKNVRSSNGEQLIDLSTTGTAAAEQVGSRNGNQTQPPNAKRRRPSKDTEQLSTTSSVPGTEAITSPSAMTTSPLLQKNSGGNTVAVSASGSFESPTNIGNLPAARSSLQRASTQQQQQQQQRQDMNSSAILSPQGSGAMARPRGQQMNPYTNNPMQNFYAQQSHSSNQSGQAGNNFATGIAHKSPQFIQNVGRQNSTSNDASSVQGMRQQNTMMPGRNQQSHGAQLQSSFGGQQGMQSSHQSPNLGQFQGYEDQNYLNMDYVMNGRGVNDSNGNASNAFPGQLEAALGSSMRDRMF